MTREEAIKNIKEHCYFANLKPQAKEALDMAIQALEAIKALSDDMKICQKSITDKKVLIGFNMAVALCNKHLSESEEK